MHFTPSPRVPRLRRDDDGVPGIYDLMIVVSEHVGKLDAAQPVYPSLRAGLIPLHTHYHSVMESHYLSATSAVAHKRDEDPYAVAQALLELAGASVKIASDLLVVWKRTQGLSPDDTRNRRPKQTPKTIPLADALESEIGESADIEE